MAFKEREKSILEYLREHKEASVATSPTLTTWSRKPICPSDSPPFGRSLSERKNATRRFFQSIILHLTCNAGYG